LAPKVVGNRVLGGGTAKVRQAANGIEVAVAERDRSQFDTIVALELDSDANRIPAVSVPGAVSLATRAKATASNTYQRDAGYGPDKAVDGNNETRWATDSGTKSAWLELDLGKPMAFARAAFRQAYPELKRIRKFAIEYWEKGQWNACYEGVDPGEKTVARFSTVTAQRVRLNITESSDGPTVWEFGLFSPDTQSSKKP
jgi:alpha-L-fucosidase